MEDKVLSERDVHSIVKILQESSTLINDLHVLRGALGLTLAEHDEIARRVDRDRSGTYLHLCLVLNKWIELNGSGATLRKLALILTEEKFHSTAGELLRTLDSVGMKNTGNDVKEDKSTIVTEIDEPDQVSFQKLSMNEIHNTERDEFSQGPVEASRQLTRSSDDANPIAIPSSSKVDSKPGQTAGKSSEIGMTKLKVSEKVEPKSGFLNRLRKDEIVLRSQAEFNQLLKEGPEKFSALKSIKFNDIEMNWVDFWDSVDRIKTLETIKLVSMKILRFIPVRTILLPNMKKYVLRLKRKSSDDVMEVLKQSSEVKYPVEYLIPFAKGNLGEDIWSTCLGLECVGLDFVVSSYEVTFLIEKDNSEFHVDRSYVEYHQDSNETQSSILPNFLQSFQGLKKLYLTNWCKIVGYLGLYSFPSSLTHLQLVDSVTSIRDRDLDFVLKMCRELVYLYVGAPMFSKTKHTLDLANLSPEIRYLSLYNTSITCSSPREFNHLSVLCLFDSHFHSSVNVLSIFRNIKNCCFYRTGSSTDPPFTGLKNWLEMDSLEFISISGLRIDNGDEVRGILKSYGVPSDSERFALEKNGKKQWEFVSDSGLSAWEIFDQVTNEGWNATV